MVLLGALPTLRAAECVALNPTESAAKNGRCLYGKPRGEGKVLSKNGRRWVSTFSIGQTIPDHFPVSAVRPS